MVRFFCNGCSSRGLCKSPLPIHGASGEKLHLPRRAPIAMAGQHQQQQLRSTPLLFACQMPAQRIVPQRESPRIFTQPLQELSVSAQQELRMHTPYGDEMLSYCETRLRLECAVQISLAGPCG